MKLSIKNRIALYSVIGIAGLSLGVFIAIYLSVKDFSTTQIDRKLKFEAQKHQNELIIEKDSVFFAYKEEWLEREHFEIEVYPLFVELVDTTGRTLDKSPNLLDKNLNFDLSIKETFIKTDTFSDQTIRQIQVPLFYNKELAGYIAIAASYGDTKLVLDALFDMLIMIFPILLIITFFTSKLISNVTIRPITKITDRVSEIHTENLDKRVPEQKNGDELQVLSEAVNGFLDRIDEGLKREKQFTADASHQLRTPLSVMKGNLEIALRKSRTQKEYEDEIKKAISKIDEMTEAVEKLLVLARLNKTDYQLNFEDVNLYDLSEEILINYKTEIISKKLIIDIDTSLKAKQVHSKRSFLQLIFDNLIANGVKYAYPKTAIEIFAKDTTGGFYITVFNHGPEIIDEDIDDIFMPFYRNKEHKNTRKGYGLGLAIVKKATDALDLQVFVKSENNSTSFSVFFKHFLD